MEFKITHCYFTVSKLAHVGRECALGMLKSNKTPLIVAKQYRYHVRTIGRFKNHFQLIGTTSHRPRPGRQRVTMRCQDRYVHMSHLCNQFHLESVIARTSQGIHNPKIRAKIVRNCVKRFLYDPHFQTFDGT